MNGHAIEPGQTMAGRYRIEDLAGEVAQSRTWRAMDTILNRSVGIQTMPSNDARATAFLEAARASTTVLDPRFLRVLDAVADEGGAAYVVREWTRAVPLAVLLRERPMSNRRAATLIGEVADAVARAHEVGAYHCCISPATILVNDNDVVRITGLGTEHALYASGRPDEAEGRPCDEQADVLALGRVLYACLVARWPGSRESGLSPAPTEHGRLLRPRRVRAGVSRDVDAVCDRILGDPPRHDAAPLRSARDIAAALSRLDDDEPEPTGLSPSPAAATGTPTWASSSRTTDGSPARGGTGSLPRALVITGVALLVAMLAVLAFYVGRQSAGDGAASDTSDGPKVPASSATAAARPLAARAISDFDPQGDQTENPEEAANAIDGRPDTTWTTLQYSTSPEFGGDKGGVGLLVDLGNQKAITSVGILFGATPTRFELWAAPAGTADAPTLLTELRQLDARNATGDSTRVRLDSPVRTQFVLVWLTSLPQEAPGLYRGIIADISVEGTA